MTIFTRTWNAAYEADPADSDQASEGANRIRDLKTDIQERGEVDHSWAGDANDGAHKKATLIEQSSDPASASNTGFIYTKDVGGITELFYEDSNGTVLQITSNGGINYDEFASGTVMPFFQASAPTGWTQVVTHDDKALRVVSTAGGGSGGTHDLSSPPSTAHTHTVSAHTHTGPSHTHTGPSHTHAVTVNNDTHNHQVYDYVSTSAAANVFDSGGNSNSLTTIVASSGTHIETAPSAGVVGEDLYTNNDTHNHSASTGASGTGNTGASGTGDTGSSGGGDTSSDGTTAFAPLYIDVIICSKD